MSNLENQRYDENVRDVIRYISMNRVEEEIYLSVYEFIYGNKLLQDCTKLYVAVSGGADSMALLGFMQKYKEEFGIDEVAAVHVNHGIRGETAKRDQRFVENYCKENDIELVVFNAEDDGIEVPVNASEEWARELRYNYFNRLIRPGVKIATAHTLSDQTETAIFRIARGCGLKGMSGIPKSRDSYIRPFLCITRRDVENLIYYYDLNNIEDETNLTNAYSRNLIRHSIIPVLKKINPSFEVSVGKLCERVGKAQNYIETQARNRLACGEKIKGIKYSTEAFVGQDDIIIEEMIYLIIQQFGVVNEQYIETIKQYIYRADCAEYKEMLLGELEINSTYSIMVTNRFITIKDRSTKEYAINTGENSFGIYGHNFSIVPVTKEEFVIASRDKFNLCFYTTLSKLKLDSCTVRRKKNGDTFKPACKMEGKLVKFIREIPLAERNDVPIIESADNIIWVYGVGFTDGFTPDGTENDIIKVY